MINTTVIIIGGGPAGAACAGRLHQHRIDCVVLDRDAFPRNKPCAGWLTPEVFNLLQVKPEDYPHHLTEFRSFEISLRGIKFRLPTHQYAIRRIEFDHWLLSQAEINPIHHQVKSIKKVDHGFLVDGEYHAKYLIGAGGTHCPVRRTFFNMDATRNSQGLILAKEEEFVHTIIDHRCHLWFFENGLPGYAWYVPKTNSILNIGIGGSAVKLQSRGETLKDHWEYLIKKLDESGLVAGHAFNPAGYSYYLRAKSPQSRLGNAFLVGDALGLATRDMGEGIGPAIQSGLLAAKAILKGREYSVAPIPRYSFPSLLGFRR